MNRTVKYELWVMMCQCRFIDCSHSTTWWWMVVVEEAVSMRGQGVNGKSLNFPLHFAVNLNLF